jgi:hypothetical protein
LRDRQHFDFAGRLSGRSGRTRHHWRSRRRFAHTGHELIALFGVQAAQLIFDIEAQFVAMLQQDFAVDL